MANVFSLVLLLISAFSSIVSAEKIQLVCDELRAELAEELITENPEFEADTHFHIPHVGFYCTVSDFRIDHTTQVDCDVYPTQRTSVKVVRFTTSKVLHLPYGIFRYFPNIREFDISNCEVEVLQRFEDAKNLVFLIIANNNLTELTASLFVDAPMLTVIDFSHNKIEKINKFAFAEARSLSRVVLSHNNITELDGRLFKDLRFLDQIFLDNNRIEFVPLELFTSNGLLQKIVLSNNRISTFSCNHLTGLKYLEVLHLAGNRLAEFNPSSLETKLDSLNVNNNNLTQLLLKRMVSVDAANNSITDVISLDDGSALNSLILANNSLKGIANITNQLVNLEVLDLSFNTVGRLNISTFSKLTKLTKLDLERTDISNLDFGTFANQRDLVFLDLSYNNLNRVNWDVFLPYLTKLEELYVNGNNLTEIEGSGHIVHNFPQLRIIGITNNNFNCSYLATFFRLLTFSKIRFDLRDQPHDVNVTHINGIACSSNQNANNTFNEPTVHLQGNSVHFEMLKAKMEYFYRNDLTMFDKINSLQATIDAQDRRHEHLLATMRHWKYFIGGAALCGLIYVIIKFGRVFSETRQLNSPHNLHTSDGFPSSTTMNTAISF